VIAETLEIEMTAHTADISKKPYVQAFFDEATNTISYIVQDPSSTFCAIIDSVMDIDYAAGRITFEQADTLIQEIERRELTLEWIIETHVHADHLSAAPYIQEKLGGKIGVGSKITVVQEALVKFSTKALSSSVMGHSSINCLRMVMFIL
jgi:glyoxylase-like metal-dependent hydrolase (beta-lactamase superfamily II)